MKNLTNIIAGLALVTAASSAQAGFLFDPDGTGALGASNIDTFDIAPTSVLAKGGNQAIANYLNNPQGTHTFDVFTQGKITGLLNSSNANVLPAGFTGELTVVMGYKEQVTTATVISGILGLATFKPIAGPSFIEIYYDQSPDSNRFNGTGYGADAGTTKIFSSVITGSDSIANTFTSDLTKSPQNLDRNSNDANGDTNANDWRNALAGNASQQSVTGSGVQSDLTIGNSATFDSNFFKNISEIISASFTNIDLLAPFSVEGSNDPMRQFITTAGAAAPNYVVWDGVAGTGTTLGNINGGIANVDGVWYASGPDFLFSTDANISLTAKSIPEPGVLAIFGIGLMAMGLSSRKKSA